MIQATTTKPDLCQVRSRTQSPCLHRAVVQIRGIPFCEACAREQEVYFAIGELTQERPDLRSEPLGKTLEGMRRQLADGRAAARCFDLPSVEETERLAVMKS